MPCCTAWPVHSDALLYSLTSWSWCPVVQLDQLILMPCCTAWLVDSDALLYSLTVFFWCSVVQLDQLITMHCCTVSCRLIVMIIRDLWSTYPSEAHKQYNTKPEEEIHMKVTISLRAIERDQVLNSSSLDCWPVYREGSLHEAMTLLGSAVDRDQLMCSSRDVCWLLMNYL